MQSLRNLFVAVCACVVAPCFVIAQDNPATKIIGQWREYEPGSNLVEFAKDGSWKMFLKAGEIPNAYQ